MSGEVLLPGKEANVLKGHEGAVLAARFNADGNYCLSCGKDRTIRLWNPHRGIHIKTYKSHGREICRSCPGGLLLCTVAAAWWETIDPTRTFGPIGGECIPWDLTWDNSKLCSCGGDRQIFYWDVSTGRVIRKFRGHDSEVTSLANSNSSHTSIEHGYIVVSWLTDAFANIIVVWSFNTVDFEATKLLTVIFL
ncbi:hypothetical protein TEA_017493 [Camellia sinensis var. sinensis]|uniref:Uncharacterized protein n=1 Tax=Camellia sinensis var. sinensis TaxID=542762 RepID=A0A4S4DDV8_CAMSN|nr:hypothetical protein TEA_017493 [Camellia sinensis var. sinensis]